MKNSNSITTILWEIVSSKIKKGKVIFATKTRPTFEKEGLEEKADLKFTVKLFGLNGILKETYIPLITKNGKITAIQTVDFSLGEQTEVLHDLFD